MINILSKNKHNFTYLLWLCFCLFLLIFSMGISWQIHKNMNFFYGFWHQQLNIEQTIKTYVPENTQGKQDFVYSSNEQHLLSFNEIVVAIHNQGKGLQDLVYLNNHQLEKKLLTDAEVIHLRDVSQLIDQLAIILMINFFFLLIMSGCIYKLKHVKPKPKDQVIVLMVSSVMLVVSFSVWGFNDIFYYFHTLVFPENHQWFFYYQDSIMSSLMKAPDLFLVIGLSLSVLALLVFAFLYKFLSDKIFQN